MSVPTFESLRRGFDLLEFLVFKLYQLGSMVFCARILLRREWRR